MSPRLQAMRQWVRREASGYALAILAITLATLLHHALVMAVGLLPPYIMFFPMVMFCALIGGTGPGLLSTILGALAVTLLIVGPSEKMRVTSVTGMAALTLFCGMGTAISIVAGRLRAVRHNAQEQARRAEATAAELHTVAQKLRMVVESAPNALIMTNSEGQIVSANTQAEKLFGYPREQLIGQSVEMLVPQRFRAAHPGYRRGFVADPQVRPMGAGRDLFGLRQDGSEVPIEIALNPIQTDQGLLVLASVVNITRRKEVEETLKAAKAAAEEANRSKDHFLAVLSHELRTPLTPVLAAVSMLREETQDADLRDMMEMVQRNVEMEARLIDDLLDLTRIARGKIELRKQPVRLGKVIERAVEVCRPDIEARGVHFGLDLDGCAPSLVHADPARLQQIFWNLLRNAVKFTPRDGCVGIRCRPDGDGQVIAEVNDSGMGIEPQAMSRIFMAFEQAGQAITRQFGGLGLGLAITKVLVELHGGTIEARSDGKGKGASFRVKLPLISPESKVLSPESKTHSGLGTQDSAPPETHRFLRILLVEDHPDTAKTMRQLLIMDGHDVIIAGNVATALEQASQHRFDLILSDLGLPDASGIDLLRQLRSRGHTTPAIALSGYDQPQDIQETRDAGFAAHISKPVSPDRLAQAIAATTRGVGPAR